MTQFDYGARAELYPSRRYAKTSQEMYRRFRTAAEAIQFIMEEKPATWLVGSYLEVAERRYDGEAIRNLYLSDAYPLPRRQQAA
jgi:hypothetical protein